jgi:drug/metabolite transporter (DMT)-like permease
VAAYLVFVRREGLIPVLAAGKPGLVSGLMWAVMYTGFMLALTLTTTANTLLVLSVGPLMTALLARAVLRAPVGARTWVAIAAATLGMAWMFSQGEGGGPSGNHLLGMLIGLAVPMASAINFVTLQKTRAHVDLVPAVLLGGAISALVMLPLALPLRAVAGDVALLAVLGVVQLSVPCMIMVVATRHLSAAEASLLALLEVLLGPIWAWLGAGEVPARQTIYGGALVLGALVFNELAQRSRRAPVPIAGPH